MEKKFHIDNEPVDMKELIHRAREIDDKFDKQEVQQTSVAANILRQHGHKVGNADEIKQTFSQNLTS